MPFVIAARRLRWLSFVSKSAGSILSLGRALAQHFPQGSASKRMYKTYKTTALTSMEGLRISWDLTHDKVAAEVDKLMVDVKKVYDKVGALSKDNMTKETLLVPLADCDFEQQVRETPVDFPQHVSSDKSMRDACTEAAKTLSQFSIEMSMRQDVFDNLVAFSETAAADALGPEWARYLKRLIENGIRSGLHLDSAKRDEVKAIKKKLSTMGIDYEKNLSDDVTKLLFSFEELAGLPDDFIKNLPKKEDKFELSLDYPDYFPTMKKCRVAETRRRMENAFHSRCLKENTAILEELVRLRHRKSQLLGFPTHAAFVLQQRMAKSAERVKQFLEELGEKLQPLVKQEIDQFLQYSTCLMNEDFQYKRDECEQLGESYDGRINMWDFRYYMTMTEERQYSVDSQALKEFFPMEVVTAGLLDIYQRLLGLRFQKIDNPPTWHPDANMTCLQYSVRDDESDELLGYFYLDLFPREGKFTHAACFDLQSSCVLSNGKRQVAVAAMVANFTKPTAEKPSLLEHSEVETFFHEFGHVMHHVCSRTELCFWSGTNVERDFVEAPSQMLENWCWERESLRLMSRHFMSGAALEDALLDRLIASRRANAGVFYARQIMLSVFDQTIHTQAEADTADVYARVCDRFMRVPATPGTNIGANFGHMAGGYDAQYYGYMWSEVYSADMFYERFKRPGRIIDREAGLSYRRRILERGGSMDAFDMLREFLGRDPSQDAFLLSKGLAVASSS